MLEVSVFADESGECGSESKYYILTLVFHDQSEAIDKPLRLYQQSLSAKGLPDIPLHASPLMNGHDEYKDMEIQTRKQLLSSFFVMLQHLPIKYAAFTYTKSQFKNMDTLMVRMRRDVVNMIFENIEWLQGFDKVKVYYDDGQEVVTKALHTALEYALSTNAVLYKGGDPQEYRLAQAADLLCTLELTALKYQAKEQSRTDYRFFGDGGSFKKNWLKKVRRKLVQ